MKLDEIFQVVPFEEEQEVILRPKYDTPVVTANQAASDPTIDFGMARDALTSVLKTGVESVEKAAEFAKAGQDAETFESVASIMKATTEAAKALLTLHKDLSQVGKPQTQELHNHIHFSGSTNDLAKMLQEKKNV